MRNTKTSILSFVALVLLAASLACTSNDTLFIKLTATPAATATREAVAGGTRFAKNDKIYATGLGRGFNVDLYEGPGSEQVAHLETCFRSTRVTVLDIARNPSNASDPFVYYQIACGKATGWLPAYELTALNPKKGKAILKSEDGKGAVMYKKADPASDQVGTCDEGTTVTVSEVIPLIAKDKSQAAQYAEVTCNKLKGFVLETLLTPGQG